MRHEQAERDAAPESSADEAASEAQAGRWQFMTYDEHRADPDAVDYARHTVRRRRDSDYAIAAFVVLMVALLIFTLGRLLNDIAALLIGVAP